MRRFPAAGALMLVLLACGEPEVTEPSDVTDAAETPEETEFNQAPLRFGQVRVRHIRVPDGYTLVDLNDRGDLLLGNAWLPKGRRRPIALPFVGRDISNNDQILGDGLTIYTRGRLRTLPTPCEPIVGSGFTWECTGAITPLAQADNGDILVTYRQDAPGTAFSPWRFLQVWRRDRQQWQEVISIFGDGTSLTGTLSDNGGVAGERENAPSPPLAFVMPRNGTGFTLSLEGACPAPSPMAYDINVRAVNDAGEVVGTAVCLVGSEVRALGARWSATGTPSPVDGFPAAIDNYGNVAGTRPDGQAVIWLRDGTEIALSEAGAPASVRKFLRRGQLFGFLGSTPVIWRFGFDRRGGH